MITLEFKATGQRLRKTGGGRPVAGSKGGYLVARFDLDREWDGMRVAASFFDREGREFAALVAGGECKVPDEVTDGRSFEVALTGRDGDVRLTTNRAVVLQGVR